MSVDVRGLSLLAPLLAKSWREGLVDYVDTVFPIRDPSVRQALQTFLADPERGLVKDIFVQTRLPYEQAPADAPMPLTAVQPPFRPFQHQLRAFERLNSVQPGGPQPTLVTTGTGSGKTESFLYPVLDHCLRARQQGQPGIKAILIYPMNALALDQARRIARAIHEDPGLRGVVTAGLFVGQDQESRSLYASVMTESSVIENHERLLTHPPDILLTNYKMLDQLLTRDKYAPLWVGAGEALRYLVLDEMHTYDGVQFADLASLIRRLYARLGVPRGQVCPVGTSATLAGGGDAAIRDLCRLATTVFGVPVAEDAVVTEVKPTLDAFLDEVQTGDVPDVDVAELLPQPQEEVGTYTERQLRLWFGDVPNPVEAGRRLRAHEWFHWLCRTTSEPVAWSRWVERAARELLGRGGADADSVSALADALLQSLLALVAYARLDEGGRPLMSVTLQVWAREMRGLVRHLTNEPSFRWADDPVVGEPVRSHAMPMVVCSECGADGWLAMVVDEAGHLETDPHRVVRVYAQAKDPHPMEAEHLRFIFSNRLGEPRFGEVAAGYLVGRVPAVYRTAPVDGESVPVYVVQPRRGRGGRFDVETCPHCGESDSLLLVSMQRASMSSVWLWRLVGSYQARDRKALAFADSVQDAALLAGFLRHRHRWTPLRTALRQQLTQGGEGAVLGDVLRQWTSDWRPRLGDDGYVRAFVDRDETEGRIAGLFPRDVRQWGEQEWGNAHLLVTWRLVRELGLHAHLGRSLYQTGEAVLYPDPDRLARAVAECRARLVGQFPDLADDEGLALRIEGVIRGWLHRMMLRGGIAHPLLEAYRSEGGNAHALRSNALYEPSRRWPKFVCDGRPPSHSVGLDPLPHVPRARRGGAATWLEDYFLEVTSGEGAPLAFRSLDMPTVSVALTESLLGAGLLDRVYWGDHSTHGLAPDALRVTGRTVRLRCSACHYELTVGEHEAERFVRTVRCIRYECHGRYEPVKEAFSAFYSRTYRESRVEPLTAAEHSALLGDEVRRRMETRFKGGDPPLHVLVCTPTLEMGIDIGDLSVVLLEEVPPAVANRVQRIGRAGRSTGVALIGQVIRERPHDRYYWQQPEELLLGEVETPRCSLDAPEVLKRHLRAYLMDAWVRDVADAHLPGTVHQLLDEEERGGFPHLWFAWVHANEQILWQTFVDLFDGEWSEGTKRELEAFLRAGEAPGGWAYGILEAIARRREEIQELKRLSRRIHERMRQPEFQTEVGRRSAEYRELVQERQQTTRLLKELRREFPLNWWTNEGLLPNFAFPDKPVLLRRMLTREDGEPRLDEYARPPLSALRELAPGNMFYAEGRQSVINQIPLTATRSELETWRMCPECSHMERESEVTTQACPACGSLGWQDAGQVVQLLRLERAASRGREQDALIRDEREERARQQGIQKTLFEFPDSPATGESVAGQVFAVEYFQRVQVRTINFGPENAQVGYRPVAGDKVPRQGFVLCSVCGATEERDAHGQTAIRHVRGFPCYRGRRVDYSLQTAMTGVHELTPVAKAEELHVYLYRSLQSEALRVTLPVQQALVEPRMATWEAILRLALRLRLGGTAQQMGIAPYDAPIPGTPYRARSLVVYDLVPGGTGHLRQLAEPGAMQRALKEAYHHIRDCVCATQGRDGCYRCLYRYETQYSQEHISRRLALEMLAPLVSDSVVWMSVAGGTERGDVISAVGGESEPRSALLESELEVLFQDALRRALERRLGPGVLTWQPFHDGVRTGVDIRWQERSGQVWWRLIHQPDDEELPLSVRTRPDFALRPVRWTGAEAPKPVVVYCDGVAYHLGEDGARLARDILVREAWRRTSEVVVFTVTWADVQAALADEIRWPDRTVALLTQGLYEAWTGPQTTPGTSSVLHRWSWTALEMVAEYLQRPLLSAWADVAMKSVVVGTAPHTRPVRLEEALTYLTNDNKWDAIRVAERRPAYHALDQRLSRLMEIPVRWADVPMGPAGALHVRLAILPLPNGRCEMEGQILLRDESTDAFLQVSAETREWAWRAFWHWHNVLQFAPSSVRFTSEASQRREVGLWAELEELAGVDPLPLRVLQVFQVSQAAGPLSEVQRTPDWVRWVQPRLRPFAERMASHGIPEPEVGYEMGEGRIVGEAELAWPEYRLCVLVGEQVDARSAFERAGWHVWVVPQDALKPGTPTLQVLADEFRTWWQTHAREEVS
ncbi:DEAD/DEAH box helicase [Alicyclobacillus mali]|uniref:DEAD/DEAH box helicase n=1 Tax=Alicyclobacillus mali (ex Roth et al. 2021) TaxID=1123961 RepID=A0ABS0F2M4_9BACL|nr:DEAD/DEAH box helicase [Alicyclobacillus mali (ex Roth et al. 2021)]MBF8377527.1 DEAD/DEAH box helicase [Alicyclobacillus mali (ex Roth et al. 2021)]MCL6487489.1 DEAD/DEAH box helicase [Alicyclobacillus mali (ex Roth et al. 2021)]